LRAAERATDGQSREEGVMNVSAEKIARNATRFEREMWTTGSWCGWLWHARCRQWERVCQGDSLSECSHRLGEIAEQRGVKGLAHLHDRRQGAVIQAHHALIVLFREEEISNMTRVDAVVDVILTQLSDAERWRLFDKLVGRIPGGHIREICVVQRPNEAR